MNYLLELKIRDVVENGIATAIQRELDDDTMLSFNSKELVLFIAQTIIQIVAAPFATDAYNNYKNLITTKAEEQGVVLTEEDSRKMFDETYIIMKDAEEFDGSWLTNWKPYEK